MNLRSLVPLILISALAACSGGSPSSNTVPLPPKSTQQATGTITFVVPQSKSATSSARKPAYISPGTTHAALFIDGSTTAASNSTTCTTGCVLTFSTTAGAHTFNGEIDNGTNVLALGTSGSQTVVVGNTNTFGITLNGAAADVTGTVDNCTASSCVTTFAVTDAALADITSGGVTGAAFDNSSVTLLPTNASVGSATSGNTVSFPDAAGNDYSVTVACLASGTFQLAATSHTPAGSLDVSTAALSGLTTPITYLQTLTTTWYTYTCNGTTISTSPGTGTVQFF